MTDTEFTEHVLLQGPATSSDILRKSFAERGCGLTVHSRVAELRRLGYHIDCEHAGTVNGRGQWLYTLVQDRLFA